MRIKNGKSVKIISFAKKEERQIQFVDVQAGQVGHLENGQMGQKDESQPKLIHLEKGQSDGGQLKYGQSSTNGHLEVIRPKLFAKNITTLNKNVQCEDRQVVEIWPDLDNEQTDKGQQNLIGQKKKQSENRRGKVYRSEERHFEDGQEEFENGQTDKGQQKLVGQKKKQSEDRHRKSYNSEDRHFGDGQEEFENGQQKLVGQKKKQSEDRHSNVYHSEERQLENGQFEEGQHDVGHLGKGQPEVKVVLKRLRFLHCSGKTYSFIYNILLIQTL
jgi:hypothetical protein